MLGGRDQALPLHRTYVWRGVARSQIRILPSHVLEIPAVRGDPVHIQRWPQHHVGALLLELRTYRFRHALDEIDVPGRAESQGRRKAGGRVELLVLGGSEAVAGVLHPQRRDAELLNRLGVADVVALLQVVRAADDAKLVLGGHVDRGQERPLARRLPGHGRILLGRGIPRVLFAAAPPKQPLPDRLSVAAGAQRAVAAERERAGPEQEAGGHEQARRHRCVHPAPPGSHTSVSCSR
mmetsp:Transcript_92353/g.258070  ORF Transcript_92353/g.258070 Transcript_92353/m.258070 type:complete len:237 (-) Transcript_92353:35-745(-)